MTAIRPAELIERKRDGGELSADEMRELILGYGAGDVLSMLNPGPLQPQAGAIGAQL